MHQNKQLPSVSPSIKPTPPPTTTPTITSSPTWTLGSQSTTPGDVAFYLMAEGGTNVAYWRNKLKSLNPAITGAKFMIHLGSAARKVDDCLEGAYEKVGESLSVSKVPVYSLPGNFDWPVSRISWINFVMVRCLTSFNIVLFLMLNNRFAPIQRSDGINGGNTLDPSTRCIGIQPQNTSFADKPTVQRTFRSSTNESSS